MVGLSSLKLFAWNGPWPKYNELLMVDLSSLNLFAWNGPWPKYNDLLKVWRPSSHVVPENGAFTTNNYKTTTNILENYFKPN